MERTIIDWLNSPFELNVMLIALIVWFAAWHLFIKKLLKKQPVTSIWYEMYELGSFAVFGIVLFLSLFVCLFIASIQYLIIYGVKMLFPLIAFWGILTIFVVLIIRAVKKH